MSEVKDSCVNGIGFGLFLAFVASIIACVVMSYEGKVVLTQHFGKKSTSNVVSSKVFKVDDPKMLYSLVLKSPTLSNQWVKYDVRIVSHDSKSLFAKFPISFWHEGGYDWSEGSREAFKYFRLPRGKYKFIIDTDVEITTKTYGQDNFSTDLSLISKSVSGYLTRRWLILSFCLFVVWVLSIIVGDSCRR